ncbi:hypothetical protein [Streptomyces sp. NPDC053048]|uniref:hypothetical protein n=1 Tax=Streptomyces sp. NPDC053048 TaxID=3365694 RepID=UPI0037D04B95
MSSEERAIGAVIGSVVGDALGAPFEFGAAGAFPNGFPAAVTGGLAGAVPGVGIAARLARPRKSSRVS